MFCDPLSDRGSQTECLHTDTLLNVVQYSTVQYSTVQYSTVQYSTVQYSSSSIYFQRILVKHKTIADGPKFQLVKTHLEL